MEVGSSTETGLQCIFHEWGNDFQDTLFCFTHKLVSRVTLLCLAHQQLSHVQTPFPV